MVTSRLNQNLAQLLMHAVGQLEKATSPDHCRVRFNWQDSGTTPACSGLICELRFSEAKEHLADEVNAAIRSSIALILGEEIGEMVCGLRVHKAGVFTHQGGGKTIRYIFGDFPRKETASEARFANLIPQLI